MTMELGSEFSLGYTFRWEEPISEVVQVSISAYGCDEDRLRLVNHFSVSLRSLETMALTPSAEVRLAVANHPGTPPATLVMLMHDHDRFVRSSAKRAVANLPARVRTAAIAAVDSPMQRFRSRLTA
jgi:hypothetical protein